MELCSYMRREGLEWVREVCSETVALGHVACFPGTEVSPVFDLWGFEAWE